MFSRDNLPYVLRLARRGKLVFYPASETNQNGELDVVGVFLVKPSRCSGVNGPPLMTWPSNCETMSWIFDA